MAVGAVLAALSGGELRLDCKLGLVAVVMMLFWPCLWMALMREMADVTLRQVKFGNGFKTDVVLQLVVALTEGHVSDCCCEDFDLVVKLIDSLLLSISPPRSHSLHNPCYSVHQWSCSSQIRNSLLIRFCNQDCRDGSLGAHLFSATDVGIWFGRSGSSNWNGIIFFAMTAALVMPTLLFSFWFP